MRPDDLPDDKVLRDAASKAAANIWYDLAEPEPTARRSEPLTFGLVGSLASGCDSEQMFRLMDDATKRLMRGVSAKDVREYLHARQPNEAGVRLAGTVAELEALLLRGFRLGDNSVEVAGGESGRGKHIDWCYTYRSSDHRWF